TIVFRATDACGNSSTCSAELMIVDNVPPVFDPIQETISLDCAAALPSFVPFTATDNSGFVTVECEEITSMNNACVETITRTCVATDACGNSTTQIQIITLT